MNGNYFRSWKDPFIREFIFLDKLLKNGVFGWINLGHTEAHLFALATPQFHSGLTLSYCTDTMPTVGPRSRSHDTTLEMDFLWVENIWCCFTEGLPVNGTVWPIFQINVIYFKVKTVLWIFLNLNRPWIYRNHSIWYGLAKKDRQWDSEIGKEIVRAWEVHRI